MRSDHASIPGVGVALLQRADPARKHTEISRLSADLAARLARAAERRGTSSELLALEAIERAVDYHDWFVQEVEKGLAQAETGQVLSHKAVGDRMEQRLADHPAAARTADTVQLSESSLAADWNRPEEDEAWKHLQGKQ